eukprot:GHVS01107167.1.p1 GENE.GHVS01107167.1~~GHVS01107167.1.p1  ORF type:complete len:707 (-),score=160.70 GHVS01107167.1:544-2664(-)
MHKQSSGPFFSGVCRVCPSFSLLSEAGVMSQDTCTGSASSGGGTVEEEEASASDCLRSCLSLPPKWSPAALSRKQLIKLIQASRHINKVITPKETVRAIVWECVRVLQCELCVLYVYDSETEQLRSVVQNNTSYSPHGMYGTTITTTDGNTTTVGNAHSLIPKVTPGNGVVGEVFETERLLRIDHVTADALRVDPVLQHIANCTHSTDTTTTTTTNATTNATTTATATTTTTSATTNTNSTSTTTTTATTSATTTATSTTTTADSTTTTAAALQTRQHNEALTNPSAPSSSTCIDECRCVCRISSVLACPVFDCDGTVIGVLLGVNKRTTIIEPTDNGEDSPGTRLANRQYGQLGGGARRGSGQGTPASFSGLFGGRSERKRTEGSEAEHKGVKGGAMREAAALMGDKMKRVIVDSDESAYGKEEGGRSSCLGSSGAATSDFLSETRLCSFNEEDEAILGHLALLAGGAMRNAVIYNEAIASRDRADGLVTLMQSLRKDLCIQSALLALASHAKKLARAEHCTVFLVDSVHASLWSLATDSGAEIRVPLRSTSPAGLCAVTSQAVMCEDPSKDGRFGEECKRSGNGSKVVAIGGFKEDVFNVICIPILGDQEVPVVVGVVQLVNKIDDEGQPRRFTDEDIRMLEVFARVVSPKLGASDFGMYATREVSTEAGLAFSKSPKEQLRKRGGARPCDQNIIREAEEEEES